jgi:hypothetical protein
MNYNRIKNWKLGDEVYNIDSLENAIEKIMSIENINSDKY